MDTFPSGLEPVSASVLKCGVCSWKAAALALCIYNTRCPRSAFPFNIAYLIFKVLLTFLSSTASCNFFICLLLQNVAGFLFLQQSSPASQVSPGAYPLPSHFPSSSPLLHEARSPLQPPQRLKAHATFLLGSTEQFVNGHICVRRSRHSI